MAAEGQRAKRLAYQRQMMKNSQSSKDGAKELSRSHSTAVHSSSGAESRRGMVQSMQPVPLSSITREDDDLFAASATAPPTSSKRALDDTSMAVDPNGNVTTRRNGSTSSRKDKERERETPTPIQTRKSSKDSTRSRSKKSPSSKTHTSSSGLLSPDQEDVSMQPPTSTSTAKPTPTPTSTATVPPTTVNGRTWRRSDGGL